MAGTNLMQEIKKAQMSGKDINREMIQTWLRRDLQAVNAMVVTILKSERVMKAISDEFYDMHLADLEKQLKEPELPFAQAEKGGKDV